MGAQSDSGHQRNDMQEENYVPDKRVREGTAQHYFIERP